MRNLMWICAALMGMFVTGESLVCHTCKLSFLDHCFYKSTQTCHRSQDSCFWGIIGHNSSLLSWETQGCINSTLCNLTDLWDLQLKGYAYKTTCCMTDRCNGASSVQLPLTAALGAALLAVWSTQSF